MTTGGSRVYRGGSWLNPAGNVRAAYRFVYHPGGRDDYLGLRLARGQPVVRQDPGPEGE